MIRTLRSWRLFVPALLSVLLLAGSARPAQGQEIPRPSVQATLLGQGRYAHGLASGIILVEDPGTTAELRPAVQSMLSERGAASVPTSINALVVTDAPNVLDRLAALLR